MFFPNCPIIYPVVPVYSFTVHPYKTISLGALNSYVGFQKVISEPLEYFDYVDPKGRSWRSPYQTQKILDYIQIKKFKSQPSKRH